MEKHYDLDTWGFTSYFVSYILKVRTLENLIDCAQRIKYRGPDENLQNELVLLKQIRDQTFFDVKYDL